METKGKYEIEALEYISKLSEGGLRDAITLMDKCLAYSKDLTLENVITALGTVNYLKMIELTKALQEHNSNAVIKSIEAIHQDGKDLKTFISQYAQFLLELNKTALGCDKAYILLPQIKDIEDLFDYLDNNEGSWNYLLTLLDVCMQLKSSIKYSQSVKYDIESTFLLECAGGK